MIVVSKNISNDELSILLGISTKTKKAPKGAMFNIQKISLGDSKLDGIVCEYNGTKYESVFSEQKFSYFRTFTSGNIEYKSGDGITAHGVNGSVLSSSPSVDGYELFMAISRAKSGIKNVLVDNYHSIASRLYKSLKTINKSAIGYVDLVNLSASVINNKKIDFIQVNDDCIVNKIIDQVPDITITKTKNATKSVLFMSMTAPFRMKSSLGQSDPIIKLTSNKNSVYGTIYNIGEESLEELKSKLLMFNMIN